MKKMICSVFLSPARDSIISRTRVKPLTRCLCSLTTVCLHCNATPFHLSAQDLPSQVATTNSCAREFPSSSRMPLVRAPAPVARALPCVVKLSAISPGRAAPSPWCRALEPLPNRVVQCCGPWRKAAASSTLQGWWWPKHSCSGFASRSKTQLECPCWAAKGAQDLGELHSCFAGPSFFGVLLNMPVYSLLSADDEILGRDVLYMVTYFFPFINWYSVTWYSWRKIISNKENLIHQNKGNMVFPPYKTSFLMGTSICTWSLWGWFFSQHFGLLLEQLGQHLGLFL
jgi:hypothetical protein